MKTKKDSPQMRFATQAVHAGLGPDAATGAPMPPVYLASTYVQDKPGGHREYEYGRTANPTRKALESAIAELEGGRFGACFASGMAAASTVLETLDSGDHVICGRDVYGGSYRLFSRVFARLGLRFSFVDATDLRALKVAATNRTRLVWIETPSNPLLRILDVRAICDWAHGRKARVAVDNTFATPALQQPLELGADLVVHSTTKYLGGHSDVVGGAVVTDDPELHAKIKFLQNAVGAIPGPLDCYLTLRGIKTLALRMDRHCANALAMAKHLLAHPEVAAVHYPGLPNNPRHELARAQMSGFGGVVSFELKGSADRAQRLVAKTRLFALAESLGGVESLIGHPATMSHASVPSAERLEAGITDNMIRLSLGIEDPEDLIADLDRAIQHSLA
ncbi:MAG: cystathionine gamma-synthase [Elusimicrobiota bacterium]|jgi:cystathionine gamma-lyase